MWLPAFRPRVCNSSEPYQLQCLFRRRWLPPKPVAVFFLCRVSRVARGVRRREIGARRFRLGSFSRSILSSIGALRKVRETRSVKKGRTAASKATAVPEAGGLNGSDRIGRGCAAFAATLLLANCRDGNHFRDSDEKSLAAVSGPIKERVRPLRAHRERTKMVKLFTVLVRQPNVRKRPAGRAPRRSTTTSGAQPQRPAGTWQFLN